MERSRDTEIINKFIIQIKQFKKNIYDFLLIANYLHLKNLVLFNFPFFEIIRLNKLAYYLQLKFVFDSKFYLKIKSWEIKDL
jgi:hypothetical protein